MFSYRQFELFSVPVRVSLVWLLAIVALLVVTINEVIPGTIRENPGSGWIAAIAVIVVGAILSVALHEVAHTAAAAYRNGEPPRVDPAALTALPDTDYYPQSPARDAIVALAGPAANLILAVIIWGIWLVLQRGSDGVLVDSVFLLALANAGLALLGMMPGYPFDGARALRAFVWYVTDDVITGTKVVAYYGYVVILAGLALGVFMVAAGRIFSVWGVWVLVTIWMCNRSAIAGVSELVLIEGSSKLQINDVILGTGRRIRVDSPIEDAIEPLLETHGSGPSLVTEQGHAVGLVDLKAVRSVPRSEWRTRQIGDVALPLSGLPEVDVTSSLRDVLESWRPGGGEVVLLRRGDRIVGAATRKVLVDHLREYLATQRIEELRRS